MKVITTTRIKGLNGKDIPAATELDINPTGPAVQRLLKSGALKPVAPPAPAPVAKEPPQIHSAEELAAISYADLQEIGKLHKLKVNGVSRDDLTAAILAAQNS